MKASDAPSQWQAIWAGRGWRARLLWPLSLVYGFLAARRKARFVRGELAVTRLPVPVIVIGNVVVGGAGKTPTTLAVLEHLLSRGWRPGVVSRGHGRHGDGVLEVRPDTPASAGGDEPVLIRQRAGVPVWVGARRTKAAEALLSRHPEVNVIVCDDGLQHLALARDVAVAVFDDRGLGNGWLLPAGLLREPWPPSASDTWAPQVILQQEWEASPVAPVPVPSGSRAFRATRRLSKVAFDSQGRSHQLRTLRAGKLLAVAGIARPEVFFQMLRAQGLDLTRTFALPDHADAAMFDVLPRDASATVLCTEKDAVKLFASLARRPVSERPQAWCVPLELQIDTGFFLAIDQLLERRRGDGGLSSADGYQTA